MKDAPDLDHSMQFSVVEELTTLGVRFTAYADLPVPMMSISVYPMSKDVGQFPGFYFGFTRDTWRKFVDLVNEADRRWRPQ